MGGSSTGSLPRSSPRRLPLRGRVSMPANSTFHMWPQPCGTAVKLRNGTFIESAACRQTWQPSDGELQEFVLPPPCISRPGDGATIVLAAYLSAGPNTHGGEFQF